MIGQKPGCASRSLLLFLVALICCGASGCGAKKPPLGRVTGKVTLAGQPLADALVMFSPVEGGSPSAGRTAADGTYTLIYARGINGAKIGEHSVTISTYAAPLEDPPTPEVPERVPLKYREGEDLPKVTVTSGSNTLDFNLEPGPIEAPQPAKRARPSATGGFYVQIGQRPRKRLCVAPNWFVFCRGWRYIRYLASSNSGLSRVLVWGRGQSWPSALWGKPYLGSSPVRALAEERIMRRHFSSRGFTLVELLVVIAIIGTLVALLLPAVQGAREAARKASCSNNMRNVALACIQYHDTINAFPSGWILNTNPGPVQNMEGWAWSALILPYLDQRNLHKDLAVSSLSLDLVLSGRHPDPRLNGDVEHKKNILSTPLKIYMCPSDTGFTGRGQVVPSRALQGMGASAGVSVAGPFPQGMSNYMGVSGHRRVSSITPNTGIFYGNSYVRIADITDGASNTAMIGERDSQFCQSGTWVGTQNSMKPGGDDTLDASMVTGYDQPILNTIDPLGTSSLHPERCGEGFSSLHVGGAQFAFADGSVRYILNGINHHYIMQGTDPWMGADKLDHRLDKDPRPQFQGKPPGVYNRMMSRADKMPSGDL
jgi:prepilin-type N-terminal cleavage/methylation domain-containing protein/prepilin-type processing-associated H-X9-DG protein